MFSVQYLLKLRQRSTSVRQIFNVGQTNILGKLSLDKLEVNGKPTINKWVSFNCYTATTNLP